jgi:hypothetical protein
VYLQAGRPSENPIENQPQYCRVAHAFYPYCHAHFDEAVALLSVAHPEPLHGIERQVDRAHPEVVGLERIGLELDQLLVLGGDRCPWGGV